MKGLEGGLKCLEFFHQELESENDPGLKAQMQRR